MAALGLTGGDKLTQKLAEIAANVTQPAQLKVGFLEGARYPTGHRSPTSPRSRNSAQRSIVRRPL